MNETLEGLKQKADQLESDGNWDELISLSTEIIKLEQEPHEKARVYVKRGTAYNYKGDHDLAIADCTEALTLNPAHANAYVSRGIAFDKKGKYDQAIEDFTEALKIKPNNMFAYHNRGIAYINRDDHDKAIRDFDKILEQGPANAEMHLYRGFAYSLKGDHDKAIEDFTKALELTPNYANAYLCRGIAYIEQENYPDAFKDFKKADVCQPVLKVEMSEIYVAEQIADIYKDHAEEEEAKAFELYFRLSEAISNIQNKQFYWPGKSKEVAHYTSLHTLKSLAGKGPFRLYNAAYMNDPEEGIEFFEVMKKFGIEDIEKVFYKDKDKSYPSPAYIGSFVKVDKEDEEKDKLFMWRMYGKHDGQEAAGACLIFKHEGTVFAEKCGEQIGAMQQIQFQLQSKLRMSTGDISNLEERQPPKPELYEIVYSDEEIHQEFSLSPARTLSNSIHSDEWNKHELCEKLKELAESLDRIKSHLSEKDEGIKDKLKQLVRKLLDAIRFLFKARHYQEEKEVRVVQVRYYDEKNRTKEEDGVHVDTEQIPPRFYLKTHENFRFSEVILGPQTRGVPEWKRWLKEQDKTLSVKRSGINYGKPYP